MSNALAPPEVDISASRLCLTDISEQSVTINLQMSTSSMTVKQQINRESILIESKGGQPQLPIKKVGGRRSKIPIGQGANPVGLSKKTDKIRTVSLKLNKLIIHASFLNRGIHF
jgi:hypothetical protein